MGLRNTQASDIWARDCPRPGQLIQPADFPQAFLRDVLGEPKLHVGFPRRRTHSGEVRERYRESLGADRFRRVS